MRNSYAYPTSNTNNINVVRDRRKEDKLQHRE